jgi:hypothetical protein
MGSTRTAVIEDSGLMGTYAAYCTGEMRGNWRPQFDQIKEGRLPIKHQ